MIDKMKIENWELRENDCGDFKIILYLKSVHNQFGGKKDHEKLFYDIIRRKNAYYYSTSAGGYISTNYASVKQTLESVKGILQSIYHLNEWIDDENYMRSMDKDMLYKKLVHELYPVPERER